MSVNINGCSRCGAIDDLVTRVAAVGASTTWKTKVNRSDFHTQDDLKIWEIALCKSCLISSYKDHFKGNIKLAITFFGVSILMAVGALYVFKEFGQYPASEVAQTGRVSLLGGAASLILLFVLLVAACFLVGTAINLIVALTRHSRNRKIVTADSLPQKHQDKAFRTEGYRIIREVEKDDANPNEAVMHKFPLPQFKAFADLPLTNQQKSKLDEKSASRGRVITAIVQSRDGLAKASLPAWRTLLTNGQNDAIREHKKAANNLIQPTRYTRG
jgi:hypothetical protein